MTATCNYQDITWQQLITHLLQKEGEYTFIIGISIYWDTGIITFNTSQYSYESITNEMKICDKICNFVSLLQVSKPIGIWLWKLLRQLRANPGCSATNPFLIATIGGFNAMSSNWFTSDATTLEGFKIEAITSQFGLQQNTKEPTHIQGKRASCIDLIFIFKPNLVMDSGIHTSLNERSNTSHNKIVFIKFILKARYPPPYKREVWYFQKTNTDHMKRTINGFPWERSLTNLYFYNTVYLFHETINNTFSNFIPHETITFDDKDLKWINSKVKL